jgi:hypothetical protein
VIAGSNPTRGSEVCPLFLCLCYPKSVEAFQRDDSMCKESSQLLKISVTETMNSELEQAKNNPLRREENIKNLSE